MKLNYAEIKLNFFKYLAQQSNIDIDLNNLDNVSIFSFSDDFKEFVTDTYKLDDSIFSFDLNDILSYSFSDGKMVDDTPEDGNQFALDFLNDLLSDEDVKNAIDSNKDGKLSDEEVENFFTNIANLDENSSDVSLSDVKNAFGQIKNGEFKLPDPISTTPEPTSPSSPSGPSGPSGPTGPTNPDSPSTDDGKDTKGDDTPEAKLESMSTTELNNEKTTAQAARDEQFGILNQISNGEGPVADLKKAMDKAYTDMQTELAELDSALSEELDKAKTDREAKEKAVEDNDTAIAQKTAAKSDAQADLNNATENVNSINSCISDLNSQLSSAETDEEKTAIQNKINEANEKLKKAEDDKDAAQKALDKADEELKELEGKSSQLQSDLDEAKKAEEEAEGKVNKLAENNEKLSGLKSDYDKAKEAYETGKAQAISDAKKIINEKQEYIDKINAQIPKTQKAENEKNLSADTTEKAIEEAVAAVGGNAKDLETEKKADGSYIVTEKTQDGVEVKYTFDKEGNMTSYQNGIGTFTANGNSVTIKSDMMRKWAKSQDTYTINAKLEDVVKQIRSSSPQAESLINAALGSYQASGLAGQTDICVKYANFVLSQFGHPIGEYSKDVKANNKEVSLSEAKTGDVYNNNRHIGIVLLHITDKNGKEIFLTADGTSSGVTLNIRDGKDESLAQAARIFKGLTA